MLAVALSVSLFALGCNEGSSPTEPIVTPPTVTSVYKSQSSGIHAQRGELIFDNERWAAVWAEIHDGGTAPSLPAVDFSTDMIVLAALGDQPDGCWQLQISSVRPEVVRVVVNATATHPPAGCGCPTTISNPVHVVRTTKLEAEGQFTFSRTITGNCG